MYCHKGLWKWKAVSIFIDILLPDSLEYIKNNFTVFMCNLYLCIFLNLPVLLSKNCKDVRTVRQIYYLVNTACMQRITSAVEYDWNNFTDYYSWSICIAVPQQHEHLIDWGIWSVIRLIIDVTITKFQKLY